MFLSSIESRIRSKAFDYLIERTDNALRDPAVVQKIGAPLAAQLLEVNASLFLPNVHHDKVVLPDAQKDTTNPILLPITKEQSWHIQQIVAPVKQRPMKSWSLEEPIYSKTYDLAATREDITRQAAAHHQPEQSTEVHMDEPAAHTINVASTIYNQWLRPDSYAVSRPVVAVRYGALLGSPSNSASTLAHEEVHVRDISTDGPIALLTEYDVASEFRAYHVDEAVHSGKRKFTHNQGSYEVERFRQEHADPARPFHPTPAMIDMMIENGLVQP